MPLILLAAFVAFSSCLPVFAAPAPDAAHVLAVNPGVVSILNGKSDTVAPKMDVPIKASLKSDATGKAELMFPDDSTLSIAPGTEIALTEFVDTPKEENIVFDLAVGTVRIITGEASRRNPQAFTVNTPQASIGIRGTIVTIQVRDGETFVYLSETSGRGVTVQNRRTKQSVRMRSPGRMIIVGPDRMLDRVATTAEARSFADALRGKFKGRTVVAQANSRPVRMAGGNLSAAGNLPVATSLAPQIDQYNRMEMAKGAVAVVVNGAGHNPSAPVTPPVPVTPVPDNPPSVPDTPAPDTPPSVPDTPQVPVVPDTPQVPDTPSVPDTPTVPDTPVVGPDVPTPEPPVDTYVVSFPELAGNYSGTGEIRFIFNDDPLGTPLYANGTISMTIPAQYRSVQEGDGQKLWNITYQNISLPVLAQGQMSAASVPSASGYVYTDSRGTLPQTTGRMQTFMNNLPTANNLYVMEMDFLSNSSASISGGRWNGGTAAGDRHLSAQVASGAIILQKQ